MDAQTIDRYQRIKTQHPDAVLMIEQPDSYLLMHQDAHLVATLLDVSLSWDEALMLPRTWMEPTLQRLIKAGHRVAIAALPTTYSQPPSTSVCAEPQWPYKRCDFCGQERNPSGIHRRHFDRRAWTYYPNADAFGCASPKCKGLGQQAESDAIAQKYREQPLEQRNNAA